MVSANNAINDTVGASISGVTNTLTVTNPSNTASSAARETILVGGGTAGDPTINWNVSGVTNWEMGIDNSDSDKWKLSQGTSLGTNDTIVAFTSGSVQKPLQPGFLAYLNAVTANVTGDGTVYTVLFDTKSFDTQTSYNTGTGVFTAPVTGVYSFTASVGFSNINVAHGVGALAFNYNNGTTGYQGNSSSQVGTFMQTQASWNSSLILKMTANDTLKVVVAISGGTKTVGIQAFATFNPTITTFFSGFLMG